MKSRKPYRIIGAYDSETTNLKVDGIPKAFPILHQLGLLDGTPLDEIDHLNVEEHTQIELFRHSHELYMRLDDMVSRETDYVPVILCHNLAFDMYGLSGWLSRQNVRVLAKSARKPITFTICDEYDRPRLVIWDTLIFSQQPLERMGEDCGYSKGVGEWDYDLVRTPETPLTDAETDYAKRDIHTLLAWFGWWIRRNPDIAQDRLACNVVTKTGIVRERRRVRFSNLKGEGMKRNCAYYWLARCRLDMPKSDDELFTMLACTRGGFTFCSSVNASVPFDLEGTGKVIAAYDATSQHPAQLVSHKYPVLFRAAAPLVLELAFNLIGKIKLDTVLDKWEKPFPVAFNACFRFTNLRPRQGSVFARCGIFPIASARYKTPEQLRQDEENGDKAAYLDHMRQRAYCDTAENAECAFGKLISADVATLYITELTAWEIWQAYEWDSVEAVHGYETGKFNRPSDMDVISVMQFYKAKDEFKAARAEFYKTGTISNVESLENLGIAPAIARGMQAGTISGGDVEATYLGLKADLNAIFGISASNQYRRDTVLDGEGITYVGDFGIVNAPKTSKVWYQFGQRIVGWSRIAQVCVLMLTEKHVHTCVNGDTDSVKLLADESRLDDISCDLEKLGRAIDKAKRRVCARVRAAYPDVYDELEEIGHYVPEFQADRFCASWNKAYCTHERGKDGKRRFSFTLAGIPTRRRENKVSSFIGLNGLADRLYGLGWSFDEVCNLFLGYNTTFANDVIRLNARRFPEWGETMLERVTDYQGNTALVAEPCALALYPMSKTVNDTGSAENAVNMRYALENNGNVNTGRKLVCARGVVDLEGLDYAEIL